jgi:hypothetical protein
MLIAMDFALLPNFAKYWAGTDVALGRLPVQDRLNLHTSKSLYIC